MTYKAGDMKDWFEEYFENQESMFDLNVNIIGGENEMSPLELLRMHQMERTLDNSVLIAQKFLLGKEVEISNEDTLLHTFTYEGGDFTSNFAECPWYLDLVLGICAGFVVKKLTPPSKDSMIQKSSLDA